MTSSRRSLENQWRILLRARPERTKPSQSWEGPAFSSLSVKISTESPWFKTVLSGTRRSFTRAPTVRCPTCVCTHRLGTALAELEESTADSHLIPPCVETV